MSLIELTQERKHVIVQTIAGVALGGSTYSALLALNGVRAFVYLSLLAVISSLLAS